MNNLRGGDMPKADQPEKDPMEWSPAPKKRESNLKKNSNSNNNNPSSNPNPNPSSNPTNRLKKNKWGNEGSTNAINQPSNNNSHPQNSKN